MAGAIVFALKQSGTGVAVAEVCRKMGISEATFCNWNRAGGPEENRQLKQLVADLSLDKQMLQDVLKKKL